MSWNLRSRSTSGMTVVVVIAVVVVASILWIERGGTSPNCVPSPPTGLSVQPYFVLAACQSAADLAPHSYVSYQVPRLSDGETVIGEFSANASPNTPSWLYVLNSSELSALPSAPTSPPPTYFWVGTARTSGDLSVQVPGSPAQFYVVLENVGPVGFTVRWIEALVMYYVTPQGSR